MQVEDADDTTTNPSSVGYKPTSATDETDSSCMNPAVSTPSVPPDINHLHNDDKDDDEEDKDDEEQQIALLEEQIRNELTMDDVLLEYMEAARYNDRCIFKAILRVHPHLLNYQDEHGNTALHMASANGHITIVQHLLSFPPDQINSHLKNHVGNTPLHWAASNGQSAVVQLLLQQSSIDVLEKNEFGRSCLTEGFASDNVDVVKAMLEHDSATEERLISGGGTTTEEDVEMIGNDGNDGKEDEDEETINETNSVIQNLIFGGVSLQIREVAMATNDTQSIVGQESATHDRTGLSMWSSSIVAAHWMSRLELLVSAVNESSDDIGSSSSSNHLHRRAVVVELGAGCGTPSLVLAKRYRLQSRVYITDWNPLVLHNLQYNIDMNGLSDTAQALCLDWNNVETCWPPPSPEHDIDNDSANDQPIIIIGADLIYQSSMVELLAQVVVSLLRRNATSSSLSSRFYYVAPDVPRQGGLEFIARLQELNLQLISCRTAPNEYKSNPLQSQDDEEAFVHFPELATESFVLFEFAVGTT